MIKPERLSDAVTLYEGDCLEVLPTLAAGSIPMIWTDPPYGHKNMDGDLQSARAGKVKGARMAGPEPIQNDGSEDMQRVVGGMLSEAVRVLDDCCCCCCCCCCGGGGPSPTFAWVAQRMDSERMNFFHAVVWDKSGRGDGMGWRYRRNYEFVMVAHKSGGKLRWAEGHPAIANVVRISPPYDRVHPNEKPVDLICHFIRAHTQIGDVILDPFAGSGTTGVAAILEGRKAILIEKDPRYCDIIRRRITEAEATGPTSLFKNVKHPELFPDAACVA